VDWAILSRGVDTLVILMGRAALPKIVQRLRRAGRPTATPVALIRSVSTIEEQVLISTLGKVEKDLEGRPDLGPPVVVVIGEVVRLAQKSRPRPLLGKRILITRPVTDQAGLSLRLETLGAQCVALPTIEIRPRFIPQEEAKALLKRLPHFDWVLFTSQHGVKGLSRLTHRWRKDLPHLIQGKVCAIGPRTLDAARRVGLLVTLVPKEFSKEGIDEIFRRISVRGKRILIPRSNLGRGDSLAKNLRRRGADVEEVVLYETVPVKLAPRQVRQAVHRLDVATFTSASTVQSFLKALNQAGLSVQEGFNGAKVVAIGPETARALKAAGVRGCSLPKGSWTIQGLVEAVIEAVDQKGSDP
jgi:uroporphyrinogen III methyltransferase/synthase